MPMANSGTKCWRIVKAWEGVGLCVCHYNMAAFRCWLLVSSADWQKQTTEWHPFTRCVHFSPLPILFSYPLTPWTCFRESKYGIYLSKYPGWCAQVRCWFSGSSSPNTFLYPLPRRTPTSGTLQVMGCDIPMLRSPVYFAHSSLSTHTSFQVLGSFSHLRNLRRWRKLISCGNLKSKKISTRLLDGSCSSYV